MTDTISSPPEQPSQSEGAAPGTTAPAAELSEKQRRELWLYVAVSIVTVELLLSVGALCYGFIAAASAQGRYSFPWLVWGATMAIAPACILLTVHLADVGLFRAGRRGEADKDWQAHLPERLRKLYLIIKGAPAVVVLLGIVALGAALLTIEGALSALGSFAAALQPHIPWIAGGIALVVCVGIIAAVWLNYRSRRLYEEYAFRREVLEKTGVIIVDKGSTPLPPGSMGDMPHAIAPAESAYGRAALPVGREDARTRNAEIIDTDATVPAPPETDAGSTPGRE